MLLTTALKSWLVTNGTKATASDDEFKKAAGEALVTGKLTSDKFAELSVPEATPANNYTIDASLADHANCICGRPDVAIS